MADFSKQWCEINDPDMPWDFDIFETFTPVFTANFNTYIVQKNSKQSSSLLSIISSNLPVLSSPLPLRANEARSAVAIYAGQTK
jgi:hypothetical protein